MVPFAVQRAVVGGREEKQRTLHDDAAPVEERVHFVNLERHPSVVRQRAELGAIAGAAVDPAVGPDVVNGLDIDPIVVAEGKAADVMRRQKRRAFGGVENPERRRVLGPA